ncbi:hypothetical protein Tco_1562103 [Tanacetum coccineum]
MTDTGISLDRYTQFQEEHENGRTYRSDCETGTILGFGMFKSHGVDSDIIEDMFGDMGIGEGDGKGDGDGDLRGGRMEYCLVLGCEHRERHGRRSSLTVSSGFTSEGQITHTCGLRDTIQRLLGEGMVVTCDRLVFGGSSSDGSGCRVDGRDYVNVGIDLGIILNDRDFVIRLMVLEVIEDVKKDFGSCEEFVRGVNFCRIGL